MRGGLDLLAYVAALILIVLLILWLVQRIA